MHLRTTLALALAVALTGAAGASAFRRERSERGAELRWTTTTLTIDASSLSPPEQQAVARAAATWTATSCTTLTLAAKPGDGRRAAADIVVRRGAISVVLGEGAGVPPTMAGATLAANTEREIGDARAGVVASAVIVLDEKRTFSTKDDVAAEAPTAFDLESIVLHELGHALGLAHPVSLIRDATSVMNAGVKPGVKKRALGKDDAAGACAIFATPVGSPRLR